MRVVVNLAGIIAKNHHGIGKKICIGQENRAAMSDLCEASADLNS
jgi:hypothetical protein